jgi:hypothetical protein
VSGPLQKAIDAGGYASIVVRTVRPRGSMHIRYVGPSNTFVVYELQIGNDSYLATPDPVAAETLDVACSQIILAGTEIRLGVRNVSSNPATFVAMVYGD